MGKYPYFPSVKSKWTKPQEYEPESTPSNPNTNNYKLYFKSDGSLYKLDSSGTESSVGGSGSETHEFTTAETWNPTTQTGISKITVDSNDLTGGSLELKIDGVIKETITTQTTTNRIFNPSTSISLESKNANMDISTATYSGNKLDTTPQGLGNLSGIYVKDDGTKIFCNDASGYVWQYSLSTPWDMSTATYDNKKMNHNSQSSAMSGMTMSRDGTKAYLCSDVNNIIYQYTLSTPWDISTGSYASLSFNVGSQQTSMRDVWLSEDGTKFGIVGRSPNQIDFYDLSTAWNISTGSHVSSKTTPSGETFPSGISLSVDGKTMAVSGYTLNGTYQYDLTTSWDLSTATNSNNFVTSSWFNPPQFTILTNGNTKLYSGGYQYNDVWEFDTTAGSFTGSVLSIVG